MNSSSIPVALRALVDTVTGIYRSDTIPLHRAVIEGNEKTYLIDCIETNFVSSVGT